MFTSFMQLGTAHILLSSFMGASEDEMAGWHHQWNEHELGQTLGVDEGKEGPACFSAWSSKQLDTNGWLKSNTIKTLVYTNLCLHLLAVSLNSIDLTNILTIV